MKFKTWLACCNMQQSIIFWVSKIAVLHPVNFYCPEHYRNYFKPYAYNWYRFIRIVDCVGIQKLG